MEEFWRETVEGSRGFRFGGLYASSLGHYKWGDYKPLQAGARTGWVLCAVTGCLTDVRDDSATSC